MVAVPGPFKVSMAVRAAIFVVSVATILIGAAAMCQRGYRDQHSDNSQSELLHLSLIHI